MKYLKTYNEALFDFLKKKSDDDKIILEFIKRLEKVKDKMPYEIIKNPKREEFPLWMDKFFNNPTNGDEHDCGFLIRFDDVDIIVADDRATYANTQTQEFHHYEYSKYPFPVYIGNDIDNLAEKVFARKSYRKKLFELAYKAYKKKRINRIQDEINPAADLLPDN